jgi:excisionase family DNA binding protein
VDEVRTDLAEPANTAVFWLSLSQASRLMGFRTEKPLRTAIKSGQLRAYLLPGGRGLRVKLADLERWVETHLAYQPPAELAAAKPASARRPARQQRKALRYTAAQKKAA